MPRCPLAVLSALVVLLSAGPAPAQTCLDELQSALGDNSATARQDRRALAAAARVLGLRGDEDGCRLLVGRIRALGGPPRAPAAAALRPEVETARPVQRLEGLLRADALIGAEVRNRDDRRLGDIADVVIDPRGGTVAYVLLGRGDRLVAVPFNRLEATADRGLYVLDIDPARLAEAPALDPGNLDELAGHQQQIDAFWD
ncbi:MAG: PRC-barrel domain-containing protein [Actinomycetota bacterium]